MNPASLPLAGRRGLILGVANEHSIAWGCARSAHAQGAAVVLSCLNDKARPHVEPLANAVQAPLINCNVEVEGDLQQLVAAAASHLGGLDFVIHSIAWAPMEELHGRVIDSSAAGFARAMTVSCHSFAQLARCCEPHLSDNATLITMSYLGADQAVPNYGLMGPVKAALESMVRYMAVELGASGVRVHAVSPGPIPTRAASGLAGFDALMARAEQAAPLNRLVTLDEVGAFCAFLVGPGGSGMTGQTLYVDAGFHAMR